MQKMKHDISGCGEHPEDLEKLKRDIYMKDKDISHLECELYEQQKMYVGMLAGLKTDINVLSAKFYDEEANQRDPQFLALVKSMEKVFKGAIDGNLKQAKMLLPPHYTFHDNEISLKRVRRLSKVNSLTKFTPTPENEDEQVKPAKTVKTVPAIKETPTTLPVVAENPVIVDPKTDNLNGIVYLKHFSHMSRKFILDHWKRFKEYDKNGDRTLDLEEVVTLLRNLNCDFTVDQIEEAMHEVDRDNNQCLDFYEYLLVVEKINRKTGNAKIFKQGLSRQNSEVSKTCNVQ